MMHIDTVILSAEMDTMRKSDDDTYDSLFEISGYPNTGDIPLLNRKVREYCVPIDELRVVMGQNYADRGTLLHSVILVVIHEDFDPNTLQNDIAILKVYETLNIRSTVKIIGLISATRPLVNNNAFVTGWGRCDTMGTELCLPRASIYYPDEKLDPMLRTITFHITLPNYYCEGYKRSGVTVYPGMLCLGVAREENPVTSCLAVPGAPLVVGGLLSGIQSWGFGCGYVHDLPLVYTNVQYYKTWITHNVEILAQSTNINYTELFQATTAYVSCAWLKETRLHTPAVHTDFPKVLQPTELDIELAELWGDYYDIRDFVDNGRFHDNKVQMVKYIKLQNNDTSKLRLASTKKLEVVPFIHKDSLVSDEDDSDDANDSSDDTNDNSDDANDDSDENNVHSYDD
ncbi:uncharacterized protein [Epargyreus clarus]|uniref:uncharacterized protein isoform X2 n=1 Tax=Epargyreus clarus TaxID=520877 RepID=UPI003C2C2D9A